MRSKKLLSLTLTAAMAMANMVPMTVFAGSTPAPVGPSVSVPATTSYNTAQASTGVTVEGQGEVDAINDKAYKVYLPTSKAMGFVLDPQGLTSLASGNVSSLADLSVSAGKILPKSSSFNAAIQNRSSMPVVVSMNIGLKNTLTNIRTVTSLNAVEADTQPNMLLEVIPSTQNCLSHNQYVPTEKGVVLDSTTVANKVAMDFYLTEANWNVSKNATTGVSVLSFNNGGSGTEFSIGGYVNKNADWTTTGVTGDASSLAVEAVFKFDKAPVQAPALDKTLDAYALISANAGATRKTAPTAMPKLVTNANGTVITIANGDALRNVREDGTKGGYTVSKMYAIIDDNPISTAITPTGASLAASNYGSYEVLEMEAPRHVAYDGQRGAVTFTNQTVLNNLKGKHAAYFFVLGDGTVIKSGDVAYAN